MSGRKNISRPMIRKRAPRTNPVAQSFLAAWSVDVLRAVVEGAGVEAVGGVGLSAMAIGPP
jgi:hypothetical protein